MNPTKCVDSASTCDGDEVTVAASNQNPQEQPHILDMQPSSAAAARSLFVHPLHEYLNVITIESIQAIADMGAASIFIMMEGAKVVNKCHASKPLSINMPDGRNMKSTHICDITKSWVTIRVNWAYCAPPNSGISNGHQTIMQRRMHSYV